MTRQTDVAYVHYSIRVPVTHMYATGVGACCRDGAVTSYPGLVTCPECKETLAGQPAEGDTDGNE